MLKTRIKASQITNLTDARYFAARGVEWLGFNLTEGTENFIHPIQINAIKEWVEGPKIIGEFGLQSADEILAATEMLGLDQVQIGQFNDAAPLKAKGISVIMEIVLEKGTTIDTLAQIMEAQAENVELFLLNYSKNQITWETLKPKLEKLNPLFKKYNIILSINLDLEKLASIMDALPVYGFDLQGGEEEKVGLKSFDELDEILDALELD